MSLVLQAVQSAESLRPFSLSSCCTVPVLGVNNWNVVRAVSQLIEGCLSPEFYISGCFEHTNMIVDGDRYGGCVRVRLPSCTDTILMTWSNKVWFGSWTNSVMIKPTWLLISRVVPSLLMLSRRPHRGLVSHCGGSPSIMMVGVALP